MALDPNWSSGVPSARVQRRIAEESETPGQDAVLGMFPKEAYRSTISLTDKFPMPLSCRMAFLARPAPYDH